MKRFFTLAAILAAIGVSLFAFDTTGLHPNEAQAYNRVNRTETVNAKSWFLDRCNNTSECKFITGFLPAATASTEADIWGGNGEINWPSAAGAITVVSSSANDDSAGTGARTVTISGVDGSYDELSETVTLDGTTEVTTTGAFLRVNLVTVATAGSGGENAGDITGGIGDEEVFRVKAGRNKTNRSVYTVPADCTAYALSYVLTTGAAWTETETHTQTIDGQATIAETHTGSGAVTDVTGTHDYSYATTHTISKTHAPSSVDVYLNRSVSAGVKTETFMGTFNAGALPVALELPVIAAEKTDIWVKVVPGSVAPPSVGVTYLVREVCQ